MSSAVGCELTSDPARDQALITAADTPEEALALLPGNPARDTEVIAAWLLRDVDSQTMPLCAGVRVLRVGGDNACRYRALQDAIDNTPWPAVIRIARNAEYTRQSFKIDDQDIILEGGYPDCSARQPDASTTVIDGTGGSNLPVIRIRNRALSVANLTATAVGI